MKIKTYDHITSKGLDLFSESHCVVSDHEAPDALLVRSSKLTSDEIPSSVLVVGRAGAGVNNIPVQALTQRGIPVLNTPGANANAVKELVIAGMLLSTRNIYQALNFADQLDGTQEAMDKEVENTKKKFVGSELPGKILGVIGLGSIGVQVANAAHHLGMKVIGFDPHLSINNAWQLDSAIVQAESLRDLITQCDFLTLHVPLNNGTHHLINAEVLSACKENLTVLNFARANVVDVEAVKNSLDRGALNYYVCDFPSAQLTHHPRMIALPHLGASTTEAQENCARMIVNQVQDFLLHGHIKNSVNFPNVRMNSLSSHRLAISHHNEPNMVAQMLQVISSFKLNVEDMINKSRDTMAYTLVDVNQPIPMQCVAQLAAIQGVISVRQLG